MNWGVVMFTKSDFYKYVKNFYEYCEYPAVRYKILYHLYETPYNDDKLTSIRNDFLYSDIVDELYNEQKPDGGFGPLQSKDYSVKAKFPTSITAINRCLYIGLSLNEREILTMALDYLEDFLQGSSRHKLYNKNERAIPWQVADISTIIERINPYNELCNNYYSEWHYIISKAFEDGEYSYEKDKAAQHEVFFTKENRLIPLKIEFLLCRREQVSLELEDMLLKHFGGHAYEHGYFWDKCPMELPESFVYNKTRRWFYSFNYINQFKGSRIYLDNAVEWLVSNRNADGLWNYGTQINDPWGYFNYFSLNKNHKHNRVVDCTMEVLNFLRKYLINNGLW